MKVMVIVKASKASEAGEMPSTEIFSAMGKFNETGGLCPRTARTGSPPHIQAQLIDWTP